MFNCINTDERSEWHWESAKAMLNNSIEIYDRTIWGWVEFIAIENQSLK